MSYSLRFPAMPFFYMTEFSFQPYAFCRGAQHRGAALTSSSISTACSSPHQMPGPLHKVEEERCHSLNRIYGLSLRHKLGSKYITVEVASSTATCLYCCCAKINTAGLLEEAVCLPTRHTHLHWITAASHSHLTGAFA